MTNDEQQKAMMDLAFELCGPDKAATLTLFTRCIQGILTVNIPDPSNGLRLVAEHFLKASYKAKLGVGK